MEVIGSLFADAGILNKENFHKLEDNHYQYILGARIKNESKKVKDKIQQEKWRDGLAISIKKGKGQR